MKPTAEECAQRYEEAIERLTVQSEVNPLPKFPVAWVVRILRRELGVWGWVEATPGELRFLPAQRQDMARAIKSLPKPLTFGELRESRRLSQEHKEQIGKLVCFRAVHEAASLIESAVARGELDPHDSVGISAATRAQRQKVQRELLAEKADRRYFTRYGDQVGPSRRLLVTTAHALTHSFFCAPSRNSKSEINRPGFERRRPYANFDQALLDVLRELVVGTWGHITGEWTAGQVISALQGGLGDLAQRADIDARMLKIHEILQARAVAGKPPEK